MSPVNPYESPAEVADPPPPLTRTVTPDEAPFRSAELLTRILQTLNIALLVLCAFTMLNNELLRYATFKYHRIATGPLANEPEEVKKIEQIRGRYELLRQVSVIRRGLGGTLQIIAAFLFLVWVFVVNGNLPALGFARLFKPWVAVVAMLIPCASALLCFPVMHELAVGSDPKRVTPYGYRSGGFNWLVIAWWFSVIITYLAWLGWLALMSERYAEPDYPNMLLSQSIIFALQFVSTALTYYLVRNIWRDQKLRRELIVKGN